MKLYTLIALQIALFSKSNCVHKSDWLHINAKLNRLYRNNTS